MVEEEKMFEKKDDDRHQVMTISRMVQLWAGELKITYPVTYMRISTYLLRIKNYFLFQLFILTAEHCIYVHRSKCTNKL